MELELPNNIRMYFMHIELTHIYQNETRGAYFVTLPGRDSRPFL